MFVCRKVNKSGSTSIQVVDKSGGGYRVVCSLGTAKEEWELKRLEARGRQYVTNTSLPNEDVIARYSDLWNNIIHKIVNNMNNKIVIFTNMKGGTGKTTLLELFASYAAEQGIPLLVMDADPQLSLYKDRRDDLQDSPEAQIPWNVRPMRLDDNVQAVITQAKAVPGIVLIDCPGNIDNPNLQYLFRAADVAVMPFKYDRRTSARRLRSAVSFVR